MPRTHPKQWKAATAEETSAEYYKLVKDHGHFLVHELPDYPSVDMKSGIRVTDLIKNPTLFAAAMLDPACMHFGQLNLQAAVRKTIDEPEFRSHVEEVVLGKTWVQDPDPIDDFARNVTYILRVGYNHARIKCREHLGLKDGSSMGTTHPIEMQAVYALLELKCNSPKKLPRTDTIRKNPYLHFKHILEDSESDGDKEETNPDGDEVIEVFRSFNFHEQMAEVVMSDGSIKKASSYVRGQDGFIQFFSCWQ